MKKRKSYFFLLCFLILLTGCGSSKSDPKSWISDTEQLKNTESEYNGSALEQDDGDVQEDIPMQQESVGNTYFELFPESSDGKNSIVEKLTADSASREWILSEDTVFLATGFIKEKLGLAFVQEDTNRWTIEAPLYSFDEKNALLQVYAVLTVDAELNSIDVKKYYTLPDMSAFSESDSYCDAVQEADGETYLAMDAIKDAFAFSYLVNDESLVISGKALACEQVANTIFERIEPETTAGYVWTSDGRWMQAKELVGSEYNHQFSATSDEQAIQVESGETLRVTYYFSWFPEVAGIYFRTDSAKMAGVYCYNATTTMQEQIITVPENATEVLFSFFTNQNYIIERSFSYMGSDLSELTEEAYWEAMAEMIGNNQKTSQATKSTSYSLDKTYVTFVLDDCRPDMGRIADIFAEYGLPLCIAAPYERLMCPTLGGEETGADVCARVIAGGGEVLAHDAEALVEDNITDFNVLFKHFYVDSWALRQHGFHVDGIILAGGEGFIDGASITDAFARQYYLYSDRYGEKKYGEPYYHSRYWMGNHTEDYETFLSNLQAKKEWNVLYFHDLSEVDEDTLRGILSDVSAMDASKVEVVTYQEMYEKMWK